MKIEEFKKLDLDETILLDIREKEEFEELPMLKQATHMPKDDLIVRLELMKVATRDIITEPIYLICRAWKRSWFMSKILNRKWYNAISVEWWMIAYNEN